MPHPLNDRLQRVVRDLYGEFVPADLKAVLAELDEWFTPFNENLYLGDSVQAGLTGGEVIDEELPYATILVWNLRKVGEEGDDLVPA